MIPGRSVRLFLERPRKDWRYIQTKSKRELRAIAERRLPCMPPMWDMLTKVQRACVLVGAITRRFAFWNDTGTGKTLLSIALIDFLVERDELRHALVLVPNKINKSEWRREVKKHAPWLSVKVLTGSSSDKIIALAEDDSDIFIDTYMGFVRLCCNMAFVTPKGKKGRNKLVPDKKVVKIITRKFNALFMDESIFVKNQGKLPYRICRQISNAADAVFALNGTPFGKDPVDMWGQLNLVDQGEALGETLGLFRAAFYTEKDRFWGGKEYTFDKKMDGELHRLIAHSSLRYTADSSDLPQLVSYKKLVTLPREADAYYEQVKRELKKGRGNFKEMENVFTRGRQISSGWISYKNDDEKAQFVFDSNPKLDMLESLILSIPKGTKTIVFHDFTFSGNLIREMLTENKIGHLSLNSKTKDHDALLRDFDQRKDRDVLVCQSLAGAFGANLQVAKYGIFFESPVSPIIRKQARRRFERQHSKHKTVFQIDLVTAGTFDESILESHRTGESLFKVVIEGEKAGG